MNQHVGNLMFAVAKCQSPGYLEFSGLISSRMLKFVLSATSQPGVTRILSESPTGLWNEQGLLCSLNSPAWSPGAPGANISQAPKELTYILPLRQDYNCKSENINYAFIFLWFSFSCFSFHSRINFPVKGTFLMCQIHPCNEQVDKCGRWAHVRGCAAACSRRKPWLSQG